MTYSITRISRALRVAGLCCAVILAAASAVADPLTTTGGNAVLPLTGLAVDLPALPAGSEYHLSGSWAVTAEGSFDGRDVVDILVDGTLTAGTWITLGYFDAGVGDTLVGSIALTDDWSTTIDLWGGHWSVHGGTFDLGELGPTPAVVMTIPFESGLSILMHQFFVGTPAPAAQADLLSRLAECSVPAALWDAAAKQRWQPTQPTHRDEVRNRGEIAAARPVTLPLTGIPVAIPDDGAVWIVRKDPASQADFLDRMAPALPDVSVEVAYQEGYDGPTLFAAITTEKRDVPPRNLPDGWSPGPQLVMENGAPELTASYETPAGVVIVGFMQSTDDTDVAYLWPLLNAIATGALEAEAAAMYGEDEDDGE